MVKKNVTDLKETEILARHIISDSGIELIAQGTVLKKEYIKRLIELEIPYVYVEEYESVLGVHEICEKTSEEVKTILEKHIYKNTGDLEGICKVADEIIYEVLNDEEVMEQVAAMRSIDSNLYSHSVNVCTLSTVLAVKNKLDEDTIKAIARGSLLHDIGLRYITSRYENIDIDSDEIPTNIRSEYRKHTVYGFDALKDVEWIDDSSRDIILMHHERLDGTGYPLKLTADQLSDAVQIVQVCDDFEAKINGIGYKKQKNYEVIEYLRAYAGIKFNRKYTEQLLTMAAMYPAGLEVILSTGEHAIVVKQNKESLDRPIVNIIDENKNVIKQIDMLEELSVFVVDVSE